MPRPPLLAYSFELPDDATGVVYARSAVAARVLAADHTDGRRCWREAAVTRRPEFDSFATRAGGSPSDEEFLAAGWSVTCWHCEHRLADDGCDECADAADAAGGDPPAWVADEGRVYCSADCLTRFREAADRRQSLRAAATAALLAAHPGVVPLGAWTGSAGGCRQLGGPSCYDRDPDNVVVRFKVPGGKLSESTADGDAFHNLYCHGCRRVWVVGADRVAFDELAVRPDAVVVAGR